MAYDPGSRGLGDIITGQNTGHATADTIQSLPDSGDAAALAAAQQDYRQKRLAWLQSQIAPGGPVPPNSIAGLGFQASIKAILEGKPDPTDPNHGNPMAPDALAIQNQSDRARLLAEASAGYAPLIGMQMNAAAGKGPSSALQYFRSAADESARRTLGAAASARGTGGQRAALWQAAMGDVALQNQDSAAKAAAIGAQEQNQARAGLGSALAGLTNVYGTELYGGTQSQQGANQNAQMHADDINAGIAQNNANNATQFTRSAIDTAARFGGKVAG